MPPAIGSASASIARSDTGEPPRSPRALIPKVPEAEARRGRPRSPAGGADRGRIPLRQRRGPTDRPRGDGRQLRAEVAGRAGRPARSDGGAPQLPPGPDPDPGPEPRLRAGRVLRVAGKLAARLAGDQARAARA